MPSADPPLPPGFEVGEYRIESELGRGGMGAVYAAVQPIIGQRVAIKVLSAQCASSPDLVERFVSEARASSRIGHPNIIQVFSFGRLPDGRDYFVMEYVEGETLERRLERGMLPAREALRFLTQICQALEAAHEANIVHRDLKPENIWVATPRHAEPFVKLLDFGVAKLIDDARGITHAGAPIGTPLYMAPEQCLGRAVDARTDLYALGVILFRMFTGRLPFDGASWGEVVAQHLTEEPPPPSSIQAMDPGLERLLLSCLQKDPAGRPRSALEVADRLKVLELPGPVDGESLGAKLGATEPLRRSPRAFGAHEAFPATPNAKSPALDARDGVIQVTPDKTDAPVVTAGSTPARPTLRSGRGRPRWTIAAFAVFTSLAGGGLFLRHALLSSPRASQSASPAMEPPSPSAPIRASAQQSSASSTTVLPLVSATVVASVAGSASAVPSASYPGSKPTPLGSAARARGPVTVASSPHARGDANGLITQNPYPDP